jgi:membrane fusion protein, heavy metal efflux system
LNERGAVALKEVLSAENDTVQAQASLDQAQAAEKAAAQRLKTLNLEPGQTAPLVSTRAPISGKVTEIAVAPGEYRNDSTASLMTITDLHTVWISALVPESKIRHIQMGESVHAEFAAYPGEVFRARVMRISDTVDPQTRTIKVDAEIPNPSSRLRIGMFGQFHHLHDPVARPAVPVSAVVETNGRSIVYVEESPGVFRERTVTTGERKGDLLPILSGLSAGERIVVDGVMLLRSEEAP